MKGPLPERPSIIVGGGGPPRGLTDIVPLPGGGGGIIPCPKKGTLPLPFRAINEGGPRGTGPLPCIGGGFRRFIAVNRSV